MAQKLAGAVFLRNVCENLFAARVWRGKVGRAARKPDAIGIRGFPRQWEMMGSQDRRLALPRFCSGCLTGGGLPCRWRAPHAESNMPHPTESALSARRGAAPAARLLRLFLDPVAEPGDSGSVVGAPVGEDVVALRQFEFDVERPHQPV
jgi:hypothetical protein